MRSCHGATAVSIALFGAIDLVAGQPIPTAVLENQTEALPLDFSLRQNYPNPWNSSTSIQFSLPRAEGVALTLHNLAGQQITTLSSGWREAGTYDLHWDGRDGDGRELASGVYLYRLQTESWVSTRRLVLMK